MVASCYRRSGDYTAALEKYKWIHQNFPDDTDCNAELINEMLTVFIFKVFNFWLKFVLILVYRNEKCMKLN